MRRHTCNEFLPMSRTFCPKSLQSGLHIPDRGPLAIGNIFPAGQIISRRIVQNLIKSCVIIQILIKIMSFYVAQFIFKEKIGSDFHCTLDEIDPADLI